MSGHVFELNHVRFAFGEDEVLKDVSLSVGEGEFLAIVGPNGGGKTTLVRILLGLLAPSAGKVLLLGGDPRTTSQLCGYVPQTTEANKDFPINVLDVVLLGRSGRGRRFFPSAADREQAADLLDRFGLGDFSAARIGELSMGQRKRALVARALMSDPSVLFLDEPGASMDIEGETRLFELLRAMSPSVTIVLVTHDIGVISHYVTGVACVNGTLCYHPGAEMTREMLAMSYGDDAEVLVHGLPGRLLGPHGAHDHR